jgi:hypothetical protein
MFALTYIKGGKAQFWRNEAINKIVVGCKPFKNFCDFLAKLEVQFGDPNPDAMAKGKLEVMHQGAKTADEFILEFKLVALHSKLGDVALIEYLKWDLISLCSNLFTDYCICQRPYKSGMSGL